MEKLKSVTGSYLEGGRGMAREELPLPFPTKVTYTLKKSYMSYSFPSLSFPFHCELLPSLLFEAPKHTLKQPKGVCVCARRLQEHSKEQAHDSSVQHRNQGWRSSISSAQQLENLPCTSSHQSLSLSWLNSYRRLILFKYQPYPINKALLARD